MSTSTNKMKVKKTTVSIVVYDRNGKIKEDRGVVSETYTNPAIQAYHKLKNKLTRG